MTASALRGAVAATRARPAIAVVAGAGAVLGLGLGLPCWGGPGVPADSAAWRLLSPVLFVVGAALILLARQRPADRAGWRLLGVGVLLYGVAAWVLQWSLEFGADVGVPYWSDGIWMLAYGALVAGVVRLGRVARRGATTSAILTPLLVALSAMTIASATVFDDYVREIGDGWAGATAFAYPAWDIVLLGTIVGFVWGTDMRRAGPWLCACFAIGLLVVADIGYLHRVAHGDLSAGAWYHPLNFLAVMLLAVGAWLRPAPARPASAGGVVGAAAMLAAGVAGGVLVWDHYSRMSTTTTVLATLSLVAVGAQVLAAVVELRGLARARRLASTDELTGLPNRRGLLEGLEAERGRGLPVGLLMARVARFGEIRDAVGPELGDRLLEELAARLHAHLPGGAAMARVADDAFGLLVHDRDPERASLAMADAVRTALTEPIRLGGLSLLAEVNLGIAYGRDGEPDPATLVRQAAAAMTRARASRQDSCTYDPARDAAGSARLSLETDLRQAIDRGTLFLEFQPIVDARDGRLLKAEALVRWQHPERGRLSPAEFMPLAERSSMIRPLTQHVLDMAIAACAGWQREGLRAGVSINLAPSNLLDADLPGAIAGRIASSGIDPSLLTFEITESGVLDDPGFARGVMRALRDQGIALAVDDFGTGHASIAYLRDLPFDELKLDRSYVSSMATSREDAAIVRATVTLAHDLGLRVVVEGIEREESWRLALGVGADALQGFLIGRPMSVADIAGHARSYLASHRRMADALVSCPTPG